MKPLIVLPQGQFTPLANIYLPGLVATAINLLLILTVILFIFSILTAGLKFILSGGNKEKLDIAKRQLVNAFIGVFVVFLTWSFLGLLRDFYGVDLLTFEIPTL